MTHNGRRKPTGMIARWLSRLLHVGILGALAFAGTGFLTSCSSSVHSTTTPPPPVIAITVKSGSGQSAAVSTAFANPLVATVTSNGSPASGLTVTFSAPGTGASCTLASSSVTTDSSGDASATCTANGNVGGPYTVTATASGATTPASFSLTNSAPAGPAPFAFYVSGTEPASSSNGSATTYYALAGAVQINASGSVVKGEQDFIDGFGNTSPQPTGDSITGGTLTVNANGQGTLTLITNNTSLGVAGTETLGVQFENANHARIIQFDQTATSSGSMDRQTLGSAKGNYAFTLSGLDTDSFPVGYGGVFSVSSGTISGIADVNDGGRLNGGGTTAGPVTLGTTLTGSAGTADSFGRGVTTNLTINGTALALHYYVVGPEVIRIIDVDAAKGTLSVGGPAVGSAFGQGSTTFSASSLTASVFHLQSDIAPGAYPYGTVGMLTTTPSGPSFAAVVDDDERGTVLAKQAISGTYSMSNAVGGVTYNGYGNLSISSSTQLTFVNAMGIYMTDPALNLEDPNNSAGGGGGLLLDLSSTTPTPPLESVLSGGTGVVIPQTDTAAASFKGNYAFGMQELFALSGAISEFDYIGQGSVSSLALSGTGLVNDPFTPAFFAASAPAQYTGATFAGTATADSTNTGRYTLPLVITTGANPSQTSNIVIYQASGGLLLWQDEGLPGGGHSSGQDVASGFLEQQGSLTGLPAARKPMAKSRR
jgi:hypothetical protein